MGICSMSLNAVWSVQETLTPSVEVSGGTAYISLILDLGCSCFLKIALIPRFSKLSLDDIDGLATDPVPVAGLKLLLNECSTFVFGFESYAEAVGVKGLLVNGEAIQGHPWTYNENFSLERMTTINGRLR
jgi:hypothetical protein